MKHRRLLAVAVAIAVAGIAASTAHAADVTIRPFACQNQGGTATVPAGSTITVRQGFSEQTRGILTAFLNAQTSTLSLNGTTVDVSGAFSEPAKTSAGDWLTAVTFPTGITLAAGQSLTVVWLTTLSHPVPEVFNPAAGGDAGPPVIGSGPSTFTCTVTAV